MIAEAATTRTQLPVRVVARPVGGEDCTQIVRHNFTRPDADQQWAGSTWGRDIAPANVIDQDLHWFYAPRSLTEAVVMAFGDWWRIDVLPAVNASEVAFLITDRRFGWRLITRLQPRGQGWCTDVDEPRGAFSVDNSERNAAVARIRQEWLSVEVCNTLGFASLREVIGKTFRRAAQPTLSIEEAARTRAQAYALVEVWLAEQGYAGVDAAAVRTMLALGGLTALDAYDRTSVPSRRTRRRRAGS